MMFHKKTVKNKQLTWFGPAFSYSGYAMHNRAMIFELLKLGWDIRLMSTEEHIPEHLIGKDILVQCQHNYHIKEKEAICINLVPPPAMPFWGDYTILFTTLESSTVHTGYLNRIQQYDEIWVPCKDNIKSFLNAGVRGGKLELVPEGVDAEFWSPEHQPESKYKSKEFTFFFNGDWSYRKGIDVMISAYLNAFTSDDNVRLLLLTHYQGHGGAASESRITDEFMAMAGKVHNKKMPKVEFITEFVHDPFMPSVYCCADVFLYPTRGEAWGLPGIQAMSCGVPMITTAWGGQTDYCTKDNAYFIDVEKMDIMDDKVNLTVEFYQKQLFAFPSEAHTIKLMKHCYTHQAEVKEKGKRAREYVKNNFSWRQAGIIADKRLSQIAIARGL